MFILFPKLRMRISLFAIPSAILMLWLEGTVPFLILMLSAAFHELGHILAIYLCGFEIRRFDILPMGALLVCPEGIPYNKETIIALCGPLASIFAGGISLVLGLILQNPLWLFATVVNLVLGLFNLMPFKKLDGGKALFCGLMSKSELKQKKAEQICSAASIIAKILFLFLIFCFVVASQYNLGVVLLSASLLVQLFSESRE